MHTRKDCDEEKCDNVHNKDFASRSNSINLSSLSHRIFFQVSRAASTIQDTFLKIMPREIITQFEN